MKTVKKVFLIGLVALISTMNAQAQGQGQGERRGQRHDGERGRLGLELTEAQQEKAEAIKFNMRKAALPIQNQLGENEAKMRTLTTAEDADIKAINKLIDENAELKADLAKLRAANHQEFRKMLTEEQRLKFDSQAQRRMRKGAMHHRGERQQQGQGRQFRGQE
jgi:Spy/CpxP family protein refolding chaperone